MAASAPVDTRIVERPSTFDRVDRVKQVVGEPVLPGDDRFWILGQRLLVEVDNDAYFAVPKGFTTDGASIPNVAQWITGWKPWDEPQRWGAIAHDWLYTVPGTSKRYADRVFRALLKSEGCVLFEREVMYLAVVVGGWSAYHLDQAQGPRIYE